MNMSRTAMPGSRWLPSAAGAVSLLIAASPLALAQAQTAPRDDSAVATDAAPQTGDVQTAEDAIVVTGVRASIQSSIQAKRNETIISDSLSAADIVPPPHRRSRA